MKEKSHDIADFAGNILSAIQIGEGVQKYKKKIHDIQGREGLRVSSLGMLILNQL